MSATLTGKQALVVGGTSGIGKGIALNLASKGCNVTIMGRNATRGGEIVQTMQQLSPDAIYDFAATDATLVKHSTASAKAWIQEHKQLDYLALTAGMGTVAGRQETSEGLSDKLAIHYYTRIAFIDALLPLLRQSVDGRVLTVLSGGVHSPYAEYQSEPELKNNFGLANCANAAGMYNDIAVDCLSEEKGNENLSFTHAAPGFVNTNWGTEMPWYLRGPIRALQFLGKSPETCAEHMVKAFMDEDKKTGFHIMSETGEPAKLTNLHEVAKDTVWTHTRALLSRILAGPNS